MILILYLYIVPVIFSLRRNCTNSLHERSLQMFYSARNMLCLGLNPQVNSLAKRLESTISCVVMLSHLKDVCISN